MSLIRIITFIAVSLHTVNVSAQKTVKIYDSPDTAASYRDAKGRIDFMYQLSSIISKLDCRTEDSSLVSRLNAVLVINDKGKVEHAEILNLNVDTFCIIALKNEFLSMPKWTPARVNGNAVKSRYNFVVSCFKWEE